MVSLIQLLGVAFTTFAFSRALLRAKDKKISFSEFFFWSGIWGSLIFVVFFPRVTNYFAKLLGIGRGIDVIIYTSIGLLFYLIFRLYVKLEESEMQVTRLVREITIMQKKNKK